MKQWIKNSIIIVMVSVVGLAGNQVFGAVPFPFEDGFENRPSGDYPDENGWQNMYSGVSASVSDAQANTGSNSFHLDGTSWGRVDYVDIGTPEWTSNHMTYEVSFYVPVGVGMTSFVGFANPVPGDKAAERNVFMIDTRSGVNKISFGTYYDNRPAEDPLIDVGTYTPGTWATIKADLDFSTLQGDLWLNGQPVASGVDIKPKEWVHPEFGNLVANKWAMAVGGGDIYFDDVTLTPEPATMSLLAIGGLAMIRRRRAN